MTAEIKAAARRHLETDGANLSLRAVARDMGMVSSAVYRYVASRDDLLTALIVDAYNALGETVEAADAAVPDRGQLRQRWLAAARAVRGWALARPAEYALLFGSPVPGYAAPQDTIVAAARTPVVLLRILADGVAAGALGASALGASALAAGALAASARNPRTGRSVGLELAGRAEARLTDAVRADLERARAGIATGVPDELMLTALAGWTQLFGMVSFELFGQFNNVVEARAEFFDQQIELMADVMGL
jgi:AcrR family transcriptional regulator